MIPQLRHIWLLCPTSIFYTYFLYLFYENVRDIILNFKDHVTSSSASRDRYGVPLIAPAELRLTDLGLVDVGEFKSIK